MKLYEKIRPSLIQYGYRYPLTIAGTIVSLIAMGVFWVLYPFVKIKVAGMISQRIGHFAGNTDLFFRRRQIYGIPPRTFYIFLAGSVCNRQLMTMWKRHLFIVENRLLRGLFNYSEWLWQKTRFYGSLDWNSNEHYEFHAGKPTLAFTPQEEERGRSFLKKKGLNPDTDWFVCIYARDAEYMKTVFSRKAFNKRDWSYHDYRNADINTFNLAVQHIVDQGGYVFRMGQHVEKAFDFKHEHVFDYAVHDRDDFLDIYLMARCRFVLGTTAGICDVAMLFDVPRICVDTAPPCVPPHGKANLFIPKKIKRAATGEYVPFSEFIQKTKDQLTPMLWYSQAVANAGYEYENNSEHEILMVTQEMMERLAGEFKPTEQDLEQQKAYFDLFPKDHWAACIKTPVGRDFMRENPFLFSSEHCCGEKRSVPSACSHTEPGALCVEG